MVKLDNWQTKAERAAERRHVTKEKKLQRDRNRYHKTLSQKLLFYLDTHQDRIVSSNPNPLVEIHLWTDRSSQSITTTSSSANICMEEETNNESLLQTPEKKQQRPRADSDATTNSSCSSISIPKSGRRLRSNSDVVSYNSTGKNKGRLRSNSDVVFSSGKKKKQQQQQRPRSTSDPTTVMDSSSFAEQQPYCGCVNSFFRNCQLLKNNTTTKRKVQTTTAACTFGQHAHPTNTTLGDVLLLAVQQGGTTNEEEKILAAQEALVTSNESALVYWHNNNTFPDTKEQGGKKNASLPENASMDQQLYYTPILYSPPQTNPTTTTTTISETISYQLSSMDCPMASIVYVVMNGILIFDRYRDGILCLSNREEQLLLYGGTGSKRNRSISISSDTATNNNSNRNRSISISSDTSNNNIPSSSTTTTTTPIKEGNNKNTNKTTITIPFSTQQQPQPQQTEEEEIMYQYQLHKNLIMNLPGQILEYILTYLNDIAVGILPLVCQSWYNEIGKHSPDLWKYLLHRNSWSSHHTTNTNNNNNISQDIGIQIQNYRECFISHYIASKNLHAIVNGLQILHNYSRTGGAGFSASTLTAPTTSSSPTKLFASVTSGSNTSSNSSSSSSVNNLASCYYYSYPKDVAVKFYNQNEENINNNNNRNNNNEDTTTHNTTYTKVWSSTRALIANSKNCTVSLYDIIDSTTIGDGSSATTKKYTNKRCKQNIQVSVAPFSSKKRGKCELVAMDIDDHVIVSLVRVTNPMNNTYENWLSIVSRNDVACASSIGGANHSNQSHQSKFSLLQDGTLQTYNVMEKVLNYLPFCNDPNIMNLLYNHCSIDPISNELDLSTVDLEVETIVISCGDGNFLLEGTIILPLLSTHQQHHNDELLFVEDEDDDLFSSYSLIKILFIFSANHGEIKWIGTAAENSIETAFISSSLPSTTSLVVKKATTSNNNTSSRTETTTNTLAYAAFLSSAYSDNITKFEINDKRTNFVNVEEICDDNSSLSSSTSSSSASNNKKSFIIYETARLRPIAGSRKVVAATSTDIILIEACHDLPPIKSFAKTIFQFYKNTPASSSNDSNDLNNSSNCGSSCCNSNESETLNKNENGDNMNDIIDYIIVDGCCHGYPFLVLQDKYLLTFREEKADDGENLQLSATLIFIPSRKIIRDEVVGILVDVNVLGAGAFSMAALGDSIAVSVNNVGMFLAGHKIYSHHSASTDISSCGHSTKGRKQAKIRRDNNEDIPVSPKKKKASKRKGGNKKDGFARGMRQNA